MCLGSQCQEHQNHEPQHTTDRHWNVEDLGVDTVFELGA
jgi:hypothetical protein